MQDNAALTLSSASISGGAVTLAANATLTGNGTSAIDNATINLASSSSLETGGAFTLDDDTISGGIISGSGGGGENSINIDAADTLTLDGVTVQGNTDGTGTVDNSGTIVLENTLTLAGVGVALLLDDAGTVSLNGATIAGSSSGETLENNANTISGAGQIGKGNGDLTLQNDADGNITAQGGTLTIDAAVTNDGTMTAASGAILDLAGQVSGTGSTVIDAGGTAVVGALNSQAITYDGVGTLQITPTGNLIGAIDGLVLGDTIDFSDTSVARAIIVGSTLTVTESDGATESYVIAAAAGGSLTSDYLTSQSDKSGGTDLVLAAIPLPTIAQGPETANVAATSTEFLATGAFGVTDPSPDISYAWTIVGGSAPQPPSYDFTIDQFEVTKGSAEFDDTFLGTVPPNGPTTFGSGTFPAGQTYVTTGTFVADVNGGIDLTGSNAAALNNNAFNPQVGEAAILNTTIPSSGRMLDATTGLNYYKSFSITAIFNLTVPASSNNEYGIALTDNLPHDNPGTENVILDVFTGGGGGSAVNLIESNNVAGTSTLLDDLPLYASGVSPSSADQIELTLTYTAPGTVTIGDPSSEPVVASFELLDNGTPVAGSAQTFALTGAIFSSSEDFTRAEFFAQAPAESDTILQGTYGTLDLTEDGQWTYSLNSLGAAYQALDLGQTATDPFAVQLADGGGSSQQSLTVNVTGVGAGTLAPVAENTGNPTGQTVAAIFTDSSVAGTTSALTGIAVSQNSGSTGGVWQYSTDGANWNAIPTSASASSALALSASTLIRFLPNTDYSGPVTPLNIYGLDSSYSGGFTSGGSAVDVDVTTLAASNPSDFISSTDATVLNTSITPVAVAPDVTVPGQITVNQGASVSLTSGADKISDIDADPSDTLGNVTISGLPADVTLTYGAGNPIAITGGVAVITQAQFLDGVTLTAGSTSATLSVTAAASDVDGATATSPAQNITLTVNVGAQTDTWENTTNDTWTDFCKRGHELERRLTAAQHRQCGYRGCRLLHRYHPGDCLGDRGYADADQCERDAFGSGFARAQRRAYYRCRHLPAHKRWHAQRRDFNHECRYLRGRRGVHARNVHYQHERDCPGRRRRYADTVWRRHFGWHGVDCINRGIGCHRYFHARRIDGQWRGNRGQRRTRHCGIGYPCRRSERHRWCSVDWQRGDARCGHAQRLRHAKRRHRFHRQYGNPQSGWGDEHGPNVGAFRRRDGDGRHSVDQHRGRRSSRDWRRYSRRRGRHQ